MRDTIERCLQAAIQSQNLQVDDIVDFFQLSGPDLYDLFAAANRIRHHFLGENITLCSIVNAKSGHCSEDCAFCAQSGHHSTNAPIFDYLEPEKIIAAGKRAESMGANGFGVVTSGKSLAEQQHLDSMLQIFEAMQQSPLKISIHAGLGIIPDVATARKLKDAGVVCYNHNLETSREYFPKICSTHTFESRFSTLKILKEAGIKVCSGVLFGMGETVADRISVLRDLKAIEPDTIPLNFYHPIPGTPLEHTPPLRPLEILKIVAIFRFLFPRTTLLMAGGREVHLRDLQSFMFMAGANATMVGDYLTTKGRSPAADRQLINDLELSIREE
jgi:biotin synthase